MKKNGDCCIKTLNIISHGNHVHGGFIFKNGKSDQSKWDRVMNKDETIAFGKKISPLMCKKKCQINIRGCNALADQDDGGEKGAAGIDFAETLAKESGCTVQAATGFCENATGNQHPTQPGVFLKPTWRILTGGETQSVTPDGDWSKEGPSAGIGRWPNVIDK